ncbi:MAG TPA: LuxR C-terminal-related transcriptional regulator [Sphingomonas sp.]|jgi:two-component system nitrate/nitrite response regulator NarL|nr:LuxR C-terminal-related transcriptional regulator [Sphingomonas sp.]
MHDPLQIAIVSQNEIKREGLRKILEGRGFVVNHVLDHYSQSELVAGDDTDVVLVVVDEESDAAGAEICRRIRGAWPQRHVLIMANDIDNRLVAEAFGAGADGYISQTTSCASLAEMIKLIALGEKLVPSQIVFDLVTMSDRGNYAEVEAEMQDVNLSVREVETLRSLVRGEPNKIISRQLGITEATVKVHVKAILRKLKVVNRTQAAIWGASRGLTSADLGEDRSAAAKAGLHQLHADPAPSRVARMCLQ